MRDREALLERLSARPEEDLELMLEMFEDEDEFPDTGIDENLAIAALATDARFAALVNRIRRNKENWGIGFGRGALESNALVDQRELDERRGFYRGALFYTHYLPRKIKRRLEQEAARDKEGE